MLFEPRSEGFDRINTEQAIPQRPEPLMESEAATKHRKVVEPKTFDVWGGHGAITQQSEAVEFLAARSQLVAITQKLTMTREDIDQKQRSEFFVGHLLGIFFIAQQLYGIIAALDLLEP